MLLSAKVIQAGMAAYFERSTDQYMAQNQYRMQQLQTEIAAWYDFIERSEKLKPVHAQIEKRYAELAERMQQYYAQVATQKDEQARMISAGQQLESGSTAIGATLGKNLEEVEAIARWIMRKRYPTTALR